MTKPRKSTLDDIRLRMDAKNIIDTVDLMNEITENDNAIQKLDSDIYGYLDAHFTSLQLLKTLGMEITSEPSTYEVLLQYLYVMAGDKQPYDCVAAAKSGHVYSGLLLGRVSRSHFFGRKLFNRVTGVEED